MKLFLLILKQWGGQVLLASQAFLWGVMTVSVFMYSFKTVGLFIASGTQSAGLWLYPIAIETLAVAGFLTLLCVGLGIITTRYTQRAYRSFVGI